jgi:uncharacterized protein YndB with AHSA1/START domain
MLSSASAEPVCLVIADISGYTSYLAGVELDHAQDILADLINTVVTALRPNFKLAKLEGDAAFVFAPAEKVDGSILLDTIERCYFGFRRRRRDVRQATACECNACVRIPDLNLKFVAHHGRAIRQKVAGREELLGSDVIVVHRLLKNTIVEELGVAAYAAFSQACVEAMEIDPEALGMRRHVETYEHIGEVPVWIHDLDARWNEEDRRKRIIVGPREALATLEYDVPVPPQVVWEFVTTPGRRAAWQYGVTGINQTVPNGGRRGVGMINHCMHGTEAVIEEILDWRPWDYLTDRTTMPGGSPSFLATFEFEPTATGTHVSVRFGAPKSAKDLPLMGALEAEVRAVMDVGFATLTEQAGAELQARSQGRELEPDLPTPKPDGLFSELVQPLKMVG